MNFTKKNHNKITALNSQIGTPARDLLSKMIAHAERNAAYAADFQKWFNRRASTIELRTLCNVGGECYFGNLKHANAVDDIDAAQGRW